ncbi:glycosyltransferase [Mycoplana rhizolycopersici]|uniref:Uncharacterized protein n=1 Tax=Mycoplana rhizolycopersici TaxID=2746702 RepID=A0ABX2QJ61_9HYPH|nr:hypothetical protein [Rhizobium rhizolycopersici]
MSLRKIAGGSPASNSETTLAFAFDSGYLAPFGAMLRSMVKQRTLLDCPIAIYTDDPNVFKDPLVLAVTDVKRTVDGPLLETMYKAARDTVKRPERAAWNKGTFLKWSVFERQQTRQLLFLDVDMICRAPLEELLALRPRKPFLCAPQIQRSLFQDGDGKRRADADIEARLQRLLDGELWGPHTRRVNSGMMLIREPLLSTEFRDELLRYAFASEPQLNEQSHFSKYFAENPSLMTTVSVKYNFQANYLRYIEQAKRSDFASQATILHYAGKSKPWNATKHEPFQLEWFCA